MKLEGLSNNLIYTLIVIILSIIAYVVIVDANKSLPNNELDLKERVTLNSSTPRLVAGVQNYQYFGNKICPQGVAQLVSEAPNCNVCHAFADATKRLSDVTHHYAFIAGTTAPTNTTNPVVEPAQPGYTPQNQQEQTPKNPQPLTGQDFLRKSIVEGHWIGLEVGPLTPALAKANNIPLDVKGVLVDEVTLLSAQSGILAADVITEINGKPTPDLLSFKEATRPIAMSKEAVVTVYRAGQYKKIPIKGTEELGIAQMEGAPMIRSNATPPHGYYGPCDKCHAITKQPKNTGQMAKDGGDILTKTAPPIKWGMKPIHGNRGTCTNCHTII